MKDDHQSQDTLAPLGDHARGSGTADDPAEHVKASHKLLRLFESPWRLIKEGGKLGVKGVKRFFSVLFLFSLSNTVLFLYAIIRAFSTEFAFSKLFYLFLVLVIGICITIYAAYRTYQYVVIDTMRVVYADLAPYFQKVSEHLVDRVAGTIQGKVGLSDEQLTKALDLGSLINSKFKGTPRFLRKGIVLILKRIPIAGMLLDLREEITIGNKQAASAKLYNKVDGFISGSIFGKNNTNWVWWLLPFNILVLLLLIGSKIG